jgi:hypothetical protein
VLDDPTSTLRDQLGRERREAGGRMTGHVTVLGDEELSAGVLAFEHREEHGRHPGLDRASDLLEGLATCELSTRAVLSTCAAGGRSGVTSHEGDTQSSL